MPKIVIDLEGGLVQNVRLPKECEGQDWECVVRNYDDMDCDPDAGEICHDEIGASHTWQMWDVLFDSGETQSVECTGEDCKICEEA